MPLCSRIRVRSSFIIYYLEGQQTFPFNPGTRFPLYLATRREPFYLQLTIAEINRWSCELRYFSNFVLEREKRIGGREYRRVKLFPTKNRERDGRSVIKNNPLSIGSWCNVHICAGANLFSSYTPHVATLVISWSLQSNLG